MLLGARDAVVGDAGDACERDAQCHPHLRSKSGHCTEFLALPTTGLCFPEQECAPGYRCVDGACIERLESGATCELGRDCATGFCTIEATCD